MVGTIEKVLEVGAEGGSVTLVGRRFASGAWQFARITADQTEALYGEADVELPEPPSVDMLEWVEEWDAGLQLINRYPWAKSYPLEVHAAFRESVRVLSAAPRGVSVGSNRLAGGVLGSVPTMGPTLNCITWPVVAGSAHGKSVPGTPPPKGSSGPSLMR